MTKAAISLPKKILRNFLSLSCGEIIANTLSFFAVAYLARVLGAEGFGVLAFASAVLVFFNLIIHDGFGTFGTREIARDTSQVKMYVTNIITIKILFSFLAYACLLGFVYFIPQPIEVKKVILIYGLSLFTFVFTLNWVFLGLEKMHLTALYRIITQLVYVLGVFLLIKSKNHLLQVPFIQVGAEVVSLLVLLVLFIKSFGMIQFHFDFHFWKRICAESFPISFSSVMMGINYYADLVMLGFLADKEVLGWYNAAYKIALLILTLVTLYHLSLFPTLSQYYKRKISETRDFINNSLKVSVIVALPIAVGGMILASPIMNVVYGSQYTGGTNAFRLLIWAIAIISIRTNYKIILIAFNRQQQYMKSAIYSAIINIVLNLILIPQFSLVGAAIATLCSETVFLIMTYLNVSKSVVHIPLLNHLIKPTVSTIVMGLTIYLFLTKDTNLLTLLIALFIGMGTYLTSLIFLKAVSLKEVEFLYRK